MLVCAPLLIAQGSSSPSRWQAQYTQIYFDDVETLAPTLGAGFALYNAGSLTSNPAEEVGGTTSIKGSYSGTAQYTPYLHPDPAVIPLLPNHPYVVTFQYKILTPSSTGFDVLFSSPTGGAQGNFIPAVTISGAAGSTGTAMLSKTLGPFSDYNVSWQIDGTGAISIGNIQVIDGASNKVVATPSIGSAPTLSSGLQLSNGGSVVTDPNLVLSGKASIQLSNFATISTVPGVVNLPGNGTYAVQFSYHMTSYGAADNPNTFFGWLQPVGSNDPALQVGIQGPLKNAPPTGTYFSGALAGPASSYMLYVTIGAGATVIIDNIAILRVDVSTTSTPPGSWSRLEHLPFPRLGKYLNGSALEMAADAPAEGVPYTYSIPQIEAGLAFSDVLVGITATSQSLDPTSIQRLRNLNPNMVILPYRISEEQIANVSSPDDGSINIESQFYQGIQSQWYAKDTQGNILYETDFPSIAIMNVSPYCPTILGNTYLTYLQSWLNGVVFPSGMWDGVFFDNFNARIDPHVPNAFSPGRLNYDWNLNGVADETLASSSDMTRVAAIGIAQNVQSANPGMQLVVGNTGPQPELAMAPYVNGYTFECFNSNWYDLTQASPAYSMEGWRWLLDAYRWMDTRPLHPRVNILEGCGGGPDSIGGSGAMGQHKSYLSPTSLDIQTHRFSIGTALLGNGFYSYDLMDSQSAPYWFDEYSVNSSGVAVNDPAAKGYLGQALTDAVELAGSGTPVFSDNFESGSLNTFQGSPAGRVLTSNAPGDVISGGWSLVINNPDHSQSSTTVASSQPNAIAFAASTTYLVQFDWKVLGTVDLSLHATITGNGVTLADYDTRGIVTGDSATARFPVTIPGSGGPWQLNFTMAAGGKIAIDNVQVIQGAVGPWRRDFEYGFVLVNPLSQAHTFSASDLAGSLNRTVIRRINGTQAPDINNGQPVTGDLTLGPFDAIILLADTICGPEPGNTEVDALIARTRGPSACRFVPPFRRR